MKWIIATASALSLLMALAACGQDEDSSVIPTHTATATPTSSSPLTPTPTITPTEVVPPPGLEPGLPASVCLPNPDPVADLPDILQVIDQPLPSESVTSPLTVSGQIIAFEGVFQVALFDAAGVPIVEAFGTSQTGDAGELRPFTIDIKFNVSAQSPACLWVYERSAKDGSPVHVGQVPVVLIPASAASLTPTPAFQGTREPAVRPGSPPVAQLVDVRTGLHDGFDRTVFEFQVGLPGYRIEYVKPPIEADASGLPVEIEGTAFIRVRFEPAAGYDPSTDDVSYSGPLEITSDLPALVELERTGDFESQLTWVLGLSELVDFRVTELQAPFRVAIDVKHP